MVFLLGRFESGDRPFGEILVDWVCLLDRSDMLQRSAAHNF